MSIVLTAFFSESGTPKTGLSPTVDIHKISDSSLAINDGAMAEVAGGFYKYTFAGHDATEDYTFIVDSVTLTNDERYAIGSIDSVLASIGTVTTALTSAAATKLALSAGTIVAGTVSYDVTAASAVVFYSDDITEATADHYNGRIVIFTSGGIANQATDITDYSLVSGEGKFTVTELAEIPADNVTFVIV